MVSNKWIIPPSSFNQSDRRDSFLVAYNPSLPIYIISSTRALIHTQGEAARGHQQLYLRGLHLGEYQGSI